MVERDVRRRAEDDDHALRVDAEVGGHRRVGVEVGEVVLLLQPGIADELGRANAEALEADGRDRVGHDHPCRGAQAEVVLERGELVVVRGCARDAEPAGAQGELVRAVGEREVEAAAARPAVERVQA